MWFGAVTAGIGYVVAIPAIPSVDVQLTAASGAIVSRRATRAYST